MFLAPLVCCLTGDALVSAHSIVALLFLLLNSLLIIPKRQWTYTGNTKRYRTKSDS